MVKIWSITQKWWSVKQFSSAIFKICYNKLKPAFNYSFFTVFAQNHCSKIVNFRAKKIFCVYIILFFSWNFKMWKCYFLKRCSVRNPLSIVNLQSFHKAHFLLRYLKGIGELKYELICWIFYYSFAVETQTWLRTLQKQCSVRNLLFCNVYIDFFCI